MTVDRSPAEDAEELLLAGDRASGVDLTEGGAERRGPGTYDRSKSAEERWKEQRRRLLLGAAGVLSRDGAANASVANVLEVSGLSRGTFYRHFTDLEDAFHAVRREAALLLFKAIDDAIAPLTDPTERLRAGIGAFLGLLREHGDLARAFISEPRSSGERREELHRMVIDRFVELIRTGLEQAVAQGLPAQMPTDVTIQATVYAIEGVGLSYLKTGNEAAAPEATNALVELCLKAYR